MENMLAEYDYYDEKVSPECIASFQSRVKTLCKEYRINITCQIRPHSENKKTKLQLWLLHSENQEWYNDDALKDVILNKLTEKFRFCVENY